MGGNENRIEILSNNVTTLLFFKTAMCVIELYLHLKLTLDNVLIVIALFLHNWLKKRNMLNQVRTPAFLS
jgi:hypothetical protein